MHIDISQEPFCVRENAKRDGYHLDWTLGLNTYRKNPSVWPHCLGNHVFRHLVRLNATNSLVWCFFARESGNLLNYYTLKLWDFVVEKCVSRKWSAVRAQILRATVPWLYQLVSTCLSKSISFSLSLSLSLSLSPLPLFSIYEFCLLAALALLLFTFPHIFVWGSCFWFCIPLLRLRLRRLRLRRLRRLRLHRLRLLPTTLSHTIFQRKLCHTPYFHTTLSHTLFHTQLSHTIFVTTFVTHHFVTHLFFTQLCHNFVQLVELNRRLHCAI